MFDGCDLSMRDAVGPSAVATGFTFTMTPSLALQIIGACVGVAGIYYTRARIRESMLSRLETKRANDLAEERFKWEKERAEAENSTTESSKDESSSEEDN